MIGPAWPPGRPRSAPPLAIVPMRRPPPGGYFGKALIVDLGTRHGRVRPLDEPVLRSFIGGAGLGTWLMHRCCPPGVEPLAPEAPLIFVFSPLVGTPLTTSAKFAVVAKSPLTGRLTDALASSHFAIAGKLTGHDAIVLRGACSRPSVLMIDGSSVSVAPAEISGVCRRPRRRPAARADGSGLAGRGDRAGGRAPRALRDDLPRRPSRRPRRPRRGDGLQVVQGDHGARPRTRSPRRDPAAVLAAAKELRERSFGAATAKYRELGTMANLLAFNAISALPTRNFSAATFRRAPPRWGRRRSPSCVRSPAAPARRARSAASTCTRGPAARRPGWSTRTCSRWDRCAASATPTR